MTTFEKALKHTLGIEGGYVNDPRDSGGATRYGITENKARAWNYVGPMSELPLDLAKQIYKADYWDIIRLDEVAELSPAVALEMFDTSVNCGPSVPVKFLQRSLNLFNMQGKLYPDIAVDGLIGRNTLAALRAFLNRRGKLGSQVLVEALNCLQGAFYTELAERRPKDEAFTFGWFSNRVLKRVDE
jgi:lysozyme family protein